MIARSMARWQRQALLAGGALTAGAAVQVFLAGHSAQWNWIAMLYVMAVLAGIAKSGTA